MEQVYDNILGERMPGVGAQDINALSTVQRYRVGARLQRGNRVFHYALVGTGANGLVASHLAKVRNQQDLGFGAIPALGARVIGDRNLLLAVGAADGPAQDGSFPADYLRDATVTVRPAGTVINARIVSHPVKAAGAGTLLVQLDAPLPVAVAIGNQQEGIANKYANVVHFVDGVANQLFQPVVGVPMLDAPATNYVWLQTWGPCACIGAGGAGGPGGAIDNLAVYAGGDGALAVFALNGGIQQYVGNTLASGDVAGGQGAPFVDLKLDP